MLSKFKKWANFRILRYPWLHTVVFQLSPWALLATVKTVQTPAWPLWEPCELSGLQPDGPHWAVLSGFASLSWDPAFCLTGPGAIWFERAQFGQSPLALGNFPLESIFRTVSGGLILYSLPDLMQWFSFCYVWIFYFNCYICQLMPIIDHTVRLLFIILILEINIIHKQASLILVLAQGFLKANHHNRR